MKKNAKKTQPNRKRLLSVVLLAIGLVASIGILTAAGLSFGNAEAAIKCNSQTEGLERCKPYSPHKYQTCTKIKGSFGTKYYWKDAGNCGNKYCADLTYIYEYGAVACVERHFGTTGTPKPTGATPTPTTLQTCKSPNYCATRTECSQVGGSVVKGSCNSGEICCNEP